MELRSEPSLPGLPQTMYMSLPPLGRYHGTSSLKCDLASFARIAKHFVELKRQLQLI